MNMSEENIDNNRNKDSLPVTVIVKRIVKKNKIKEFEEFTKWKKAQVHQEPTQQVQQQQTRAKFTIKQREDTAASDTKE